MLESCVEFGLSLTAIRDFSLTWPWPYSTVQQVSERVKSLGLEATFRRRDRKRIGDHNKAINATFVRVASQMMERGYMIERFTREQKVFDFIGLRPDYYFEAVQPGKRLTYLFEVQSSKTKFTLWFKKLRQYVTAYELFKVGRPRETFRVPIVVHSPDELTRAREGARRALVKHPRLNLFLFALIDEVNAPYANVVGTPMWKSAWKDIAPWTLLP